MTRYVVQSFPIKGGSEVAIFGTLEYAKRHAELNPCSLIFTMEQVSRIEDGYVYLHADNCKPLEV